MTVVLSPSSSSSSPSPHHVRTASPNPSHSTLPPLNTNYPAKRSIIQRPSSYAKNRMSSYSTTSNASQKPSRPPSHVYPVFHSSLPYALVRDFAYPLTHPLHYGPPAESSAAQSGRSTPLNDQRRLSDPPNTSWENSKSHWAPGPWGGDGHLGTEQLPQMAYGDDHHGPPYSEDEDLHSPVVMSSRHKKNKSAYPSLALGKGKGRGRSPGRNSRESTSDPSRASSYDADRGHYTGTNGDGSETYYISEADETADGPGGELVTYPADQARHSSSMLFPHTYHSPRQGDSSNPSQRSSQYNSSSQVDDSSLDPNAFADDSRYSRDYQFTIASPDEEMHGKAVALFDFARENENELPLVEGQVIWVSYRHGQGWLVAEDPKTRDTGLVPEEYVRLLRDIEGGWSSLSGVEPTGEPTGLLSPDSTESSTATAIASPPIDSEHTHHASHASNGNNTTTEKHPPIVSTFSTSSKDLNPYPHQLLGKETGQQPPQVVHYGSQTNTPTTMSPNAGAATFNRKGSEDKGVGKRTDTEKLKGNDNSGVKRTDSSSSRRKKDGKDKAVR